MEKVNITRCQYCGGHDIGIGYQTPAIGISVGKSGLTGCGLEYLLCKECGSVLHSKVKRPEIFKSINKEDK